VRDQRAVRLRRRAGCVRAGRLLQLSGYRAGRTQVQPNAGAASPEPSVRCGVASCGALGRMLGRPACGGNTFCDAQMCRQCVTDVGFGRRFGCAVKRRHRVVRWRERKSAGSATSACRRDAVRRVTRGAPSWSIAVPPDASACAITWRGLVLGDNGGGQLRWLDQPVADRGAGAHGERLAAHGHRRARAGDRHTWPMLGRVVLGTVMARLSDGDHGAAARRRRVNGLTRVGSPAELSTASGDRRKPCAGAIQGTVAAYDHQQDRAGAGSPRHHRGRGRSPSTGGPTVVLGRPIQPLGTGDRVLRRPSGATNPRTGPAGRSSGAGVAAGASTWCRWITGCPAGATITRSDRVGGSPFHPRRVDDAHSPGSIGSSRTGREPVRSRPTGACCAGGATAKASSVTRRS
jgi:hypothetical protein